MTRNEHFDRIMSGDISPRVVCHDNRPPTEWLYVAWTPTKEGPARGDYQAADADLRDMLRKA